MSASPANAAQGASYERDKRLASDPDVKVRCQLARSSVAPPEILYYLASDKVAAVRRKVAANRRTPFQADFLLVRDPDDDVRGDLAQKVAALLPDLAPDEQDQVRQRAISIIEILARDQTARIRRIIAEALKDVAGAPPEVMRALARDMELTVAEPVLRFSPLLTEGDLLEIIANPPALGARRAVAQRQGVTAVVADAIAEQEDEAAIAALLANPSAQVREETLDLLTDRAPAHPSWHPGLVERPSLPARVVRRIASFIAATLLDRLEQRTDLDSEARAAVVAAVRRRLAEQDETPVPGEAPVRETAEERARRLAQEGRLDEESLADALDAGERAFVIAGLALLSGIGVAIVDRILAARGAKGIVALVWKAGLSSRFAAQVQVRLGRIPPKQILAPRAGQGWPMKPDEMTWHLEFFQV